MYKEITEWFNVKKLEQVKKALEKNNFTAVILNNQAAVVRFVSEQCPPSSTVGLGGSATVRELHIDTQLEDMGCTVLNQWKASLSADEKEKVIRAQPTSDIFIASTNALTADGRLVNIDGIGNRVSSMIFGPKKVILFAGVNKIAGSLDDALKRVKQTSCPMNAKRLQIKTPCGVTGSCTDCRHERRMCTVTVITERKPPKIDFIVALLPWNAGF